MNINNIMVTINLGCNSNITHGDRVFFYITLYQTKFKQKEESCTFHNVCLALSKRIINQQKASSQGGVDKKSSTEQIAPDFL